MAGYLYSGIPQAKAQMESQGWMYRDPKLLLRLLEERRRRDMDDAELCMTDTDAQEFTIKHSSTTIQSKTDYELSQRAAELGEAYYRISTEKLKTERVSASRSISTDMTTGDLERHRSIAKLQSQVVHLGLTLASIYSDLGQYIKAQNTLRRLQSNEPAYVYNDTDRAQLFAIHLECRNYEEAYNVYNTIANLSTITTAVKSNYAWCLYQLDPANLTKATFTAARMLEECINEDHVLASTSSVSSQLNHQVRHLHAMRALRRSDDRRQDRGLVKHGWNHIKCLEESQKTLAETKKQGIELNQRVWFRAILCQAICLLDHNDRHASEIAKTTIETSQADMIRVLGSDHPEVSDSFFYLGLAYEQLRNVPKAELSLREARDKRESSLGSLHQDTTAATEALYRVGHKTVTSENNEPLPSSVLSSWKPTTEGHQEQTASTTADNISSSDTSIRDPSKFGSVASILSRFPGRSFKETVKQARAKRSKIEHMKFSVLKHNTTTEVELTASLDTLAYGNFITSLEVEYLGYQESMTSFTGPGYKCANGSEIKPVGVISLLYRLPDKVTEKLSRKVLGMDDFLVVNELPCRVILGIAFISKYNLLISGPGQGISFGIVPEHACIPPTDLNLAVEPLNEAHTEKLLLVIALKAQKKPTAAQQSKIDQVEQEREQQKAEERAQNATQRAQEAARLILQSSQSQQNPNLSTNGFQSHPGNSIQPLHKTTFT